MRRYIIIVLLSFLPVLAFSQGAPSPHFGAKGGINFTTVGGESNAFTVKGNLGIYGVYFFDYFWHIKAELLYSGQGHGAQSDTDGKLNLNYLNLPILAGYSPNYNLNFHLGPQIGFLLGAKSKFQGNTTDVKDFFNTVDVGLVFDVAYYFLEKRLGASARYIHGLSNISNVSGESRFNRVIQLTASWRLFVSE